MNPYTKTWKDYQKKEPKYIYLLGAGLLAWFGGAVILAHYLGPIAL